jgi:cell division protein FtsL
MVCLSGLGEVYLEHQKRILFIEYQGLIKERDALKTEWKRIQIELSELSSGLRLEDIARSKVNMSIPDPSEINIIDLNDSSK